MIKCEKGDIDIEGNAAEILADISCLIMELSTDKELCKEFKSIEEKLIDKKENIRSQLLIDIFSMFENFKNKYEKWYNKGDI